MKIFIAIALLTLIAVAGARLYRQASKTLESKLAKSKGPAEDEPRKTAQSLVLAHDFRGHCLITTYGECATAFEVTGPNLSLVTAEEKDAHIARLSAALSGERSPYTIYRLLAPVDASEQVRALRRQVELIDEEEAQLLGGIAAFGKKPSFATDKRLRALRVRRDYIERAYLPLYGAQDDAFVSRAFVVLSFDGGERACAAAMKTTEDFMARLVSAGYQASLLGPDEWVRFLIALNGRFPSPDENVRASAEYLYQPELAQGGVR